MTAERSFVLKGFCPYDILALYDKFGLDVGKHLRGDFCIEKGRNIIHASDTVENAEKEIALWFTKEEVQSWKKVDEKMVYEI